MPPAGLLTLLLAVSVRSGTGSLERTENSRSVRCSKDLLCNKHSIGGLCMPGEKYPPYGTIVVPSNLRTTTILHCPPKEDCTACVHVEVTLSVSTLPGMETNESYTDTDDYYEDEDEDIVEEVDDKDEGMETNESYTDTDDYYEDEDEDIVEEVDDKDEDPGFMQTKLFIAQVFPTQQCVEADVRVPLSLIQQSADQEKIGTVIFDCFVAAPSSELKVTAYTKPRFHEELRNTHKVPGCRLKALRDEVKICEVPKLNISFERDVHIQILNHSKGRTYFLRLEHNRSRKLPHSNHKLIGESNHTISRSDIVPCLCVQVWLDYVDAIRWKDCMFENMPEFQENTWRKSNLTLKHQRDKLTWEFTALCNVSAEISLCWTPRLGSACHEIPHSRRKIFVYISVMQEFQGVMPHPHLCVQVRGDKKIWHTKCPYKDFSTPWTGDGVLLMIIQNSPSNFSFCVLEDGACVPLSNSTSLQNFNYLEENLLQDVMAGKCEEVWSPNGNLSGAVVLCSLDEYIHRHWALIWVACLVITCCILLLLILKKKALEGCIHYIKQDYSSAGLFHNRRILLLYSPDHDYYKMLIGTLASALSELHLKVVVDLWYNGELDTLGPMAWFHRQRLDVIEEAGIIVLLFSKGALAMCNKWLQSAQKTQGPVPCKDPHSAFATALNCVLPDFLDGQSRGRYVIACFEDLFNHKEIPVPFQRVPVLKLPSQLTEFLVALTKGHHTLPKKSLLKSDSVRISSRLQKAIKQCQMQESSLPLTCQWTDKSPETSSSDCSRDSLELHCLLER